MKFMLMMNVPHDTGDYQRSSQPAFGAKGRIGPCQLQTAIAALHDAAPTTGQTDWAQIDALCGLLQRMSVNPMVALNRAVATAMIEAARLASRR
jgi:predicted RNA polymerase sigma factor